MERIGITGGIGSGKSTVSEYLRNKGHYVIDADEIGREMTARPEVVSEISDALGEIVLSSDGTLDRRATAALVFSDKDAEKKLGEIVTRAICEECRRIMDMEEESGRDIIFLDAPLIFETGLDESLSQVWLVTCDMETRIQRVMDRDGISRDEVLARINAQMSDEEKAKLASHVIDNSGDEKELTEKVDFLLSFH